MSVAQLIDEARDASRYEGATLVIFPGSTRGPRLTLQWDARRERWRGTCSDDSHYHTFLAPCSVQGSDDVVAVAGALDAYLDALNHGLGGSGNRDRIDWANREIRELAQQ